jgi:serine phosphatase RsbU (regulator of sigma subunit)/DNA-binding transcriptional regulator YhcF (GntR family)
MLLNLTDLSAEPLHRQISIQLARRMLDGDLEPGTQLPSLAAMARRQHVSRSTVELAYTELAREGLVRLRPRKGPVVNQTGPDERQAAAARLGIGHQALLCAIESFSGRLASIVDKHKMCLVLTESLRNHLSPQGVAIAWREGADGMWSILTDGGTTRRFRPHDDDPLLQRLRTADQVSAAGHEHGGAGEGTLEGELSEIDGAVIFPLRHADGLVGLVALGERGPGREYSEYELDLISVFANQFATALAMADLYLDSLEKRRMEHELETAKRIQVNLLPSQPPDRDEIGMAAFTSPSGAVGGDFYDYFVIDPSRVGLVIADACGNGVPAAMLVSQIQAILRSEVADGRPLQHTLEHLDRHLQKHAESGFFATFFYGILDTTTGALEYANAGHDFPLLVRRNGRTEALKSTGPALGVGADLAHETGYVDRHEGDCLVLYTDGITEATSSRGKQYGEAQLRDMAIRCRHKSPDEILSFVRYDVERFTSPDPPDDDMTMMVLKVNRLSAGETHAA